MVRQKQITETGPNPLRGVRNPDLYPQASNPIDAALSESQLNDIQNLKAKALYRNYDVSQGHIGYEALRDPSLITPINTGLDYGSSTYDKGLLINATPEDIQNQRASSQPWYLKVTNGLAKGVILAGTTFLDGTVGLVTGIGEAFNRKGWSGLWDNDFSRLMQTVNEISEQELPNYYSTQETEEPWYENVFTANFLGDKFIKNLGFTVGAFYSGNVFSAALKATKIPQLMGTLAKAAKFAKASEVPKMVLSGAGAAMSAVNEGRIEALNNSKQWFEDNKRVLDVEHLQRVQAIKDQYGDTAEASILIQDEIGAYNEALGKLTEDRLKMGNMDLLFNIPILTASNLFQFAKLYANGFKSSRRAVNILKRDGKFGAATTRLGATAAITRGALSEGTEEITQGMASNIAGHYYTTDVNNFYKAKTDREAEQETLDWAKSFAHGINETVNDGSAWEEFAIGAITGALGMPSFRSIKSESGSLQSPITLKGGAINEWREYKDKIKREQDIANYMNNRMQSPEFKNYYQGLIRHNKYQKDMDKATEDGDAFEFKNAEHAQLVSDILTFDNAGRLEELKGMIGEAFDTSDENLDAIVRNTTTIDENGELIGPFADWAVKEKDGSISSNFGNEESKQKMISELTKNKDDIFETIKQYQETREKLDINTGQQLSDEQLEELTWMQTQLGNWAKRAGEMSSQVKDTIDNVIGRLESQMRAAESIRTHEGMVHTGLSENYRRADRVIQLITKAINNLNFVRSLDNETMAATLAKNPDTLEGLKVQVNKLDNDVLSVNDKESVLKKLDDLSRLGNASKIYQDKFAEYLFNPKKQEEDHAKADKQNIDKDAEITRAKQVEALNKTANFQEVEALINNGEATLDDLNGSSSDAARSYKKASLFKKKATELINSSDSEHKSELLDMLNRRFNENATYDDLSNEVLATELPLEATTWDEKAQESLDNEFNKIVIAAREKVDSGNSQKQDVEAKKTGTKRPDNVGKDDVAQPPVDKPFSIDETINKIDKLNIAPEAKTEAKTLANQIANNIEKLSKSKDPKLIRQTQRSVNALSSMVGNDAIADIIDRVEKLSKPDTFNPPSLEEVLKEAEAEASKYKPTAVTGVIKSIIPQFDLDAKRDGVLIDFVGDNRNQDYSYVYNKLKEVDPKTGKNAFDYVNEGNVKEGDELEVRYEPATDEHSELLALYHKGTLVNYMNTDEAIEGVKEIKDKAKKGEQPTVRVSKVMSGQYGYDRSKPQSVGDLLGTDDATIGVMKNRSMEANTDAFVEPVFDEANSDGKVYILLPNSKGTLSPKMIHIRHLNKTEFDLDTQDNPIANDLKKVFNNLAGIANLEKGFDEALDNVYMDLIELLYIPDSFHINIVSKDNDISLQIAFADRDGKRQNRNILLKRFAKKSLLNIGAGTTQTSEPYTAPVEEVYNQVLNAFYEANLAFNVNAKKLTSKKGQEYANRLRDSNVLTTYLTGKRMQGTWFLLNEKPNTTHTDSAFERAKASQQAKGGTRVQYGGKEYFVRNGYIFDQSGSIVDLGEDAQQVKDLAYINSAYGTNYFGVNQHNGKVLIVDRNGKRGYNRATNKYLSPKEVEELEATLDGRKSKASQSATATKSLQESQKLVLRDDNGNPDTSSGSYMIKEEDGQYHEYQRVHSVIGSNYIGPSRVDAATSRGSLVDEIARQFLIDPTNVTKPEGMSDEAFGALKRGLGKFRDDANRRGLKLVADRTVVFHKYSDGRRIAGELDVFAYNPSTGEISIFDFKTSKYSTKDSSFSRVVNPRYFTRSNKDQYTLQLSAYAKLFEDSFGVPVSNLIIVPFQLKYSKEKDGVITRIFPENYVPLTYQSGVFETDKAPASQPPSSLRTIKGQYVTMGKGKLEYHQADMQVLFTTSNNQTFYLAKVDDGYKLVLPNGRSMTIDPSLVSDEVGRTRNNIMDFIQADNVAAAIQDAMSYTPLDNSPYGNSIELKEAPKETPKPDDRMKRGLDALDRLNSLKPTTPTQQASNQEAINKREKDEKASVAIDLSTALGRSQLARKKWGEMTDAEKAIISPMFEGMEEKDIQEYWDGTDAIQRESFIPACK